jgi:galactonate dehydratase
LAQLVVGEDPRRIEHLWQTMYRQHFWHGNGIVRGTAISGIDIALWDILGKIHGVPVHALLGGRVRDYVRLYSHLGSGKMEDFYRTPVSEASRFADLALQAVANGFTAFKSMAVPETAPLEGLGPIRAAEMCVKAMREAVGPSIDIMVDCHARPSPRMGMQFAKALEPYGLFWFEEPCWPETMEDIAAIQRAVSTPIATGERLVTGHAFRELFEKRAASVIQPDVTHCGGISEVRRIAAMSEAYRVALAPHNPQGPVSTAASLEVGFATPSYLICETVSGDVFPSDRPGLGIELNEAEIKKHPFQQELPMRSYYADGSVGDW